jgi:hypothetical protein
MNLSSDNLTRCHMAGLHDAESHKPMVCPVVYSDIQADEYFSGYRDGMTDMCGDQ